MATNIVNVEMILPDGVMTNATINSDAAISTSKLEIRTDQIFPIPLHIGKTWDAFHTNLPGTSSADDLALNTGTLGTNFVTIRTSDLKAAGATTRYAGFLVPVPQNYRDGGSFEIRVTGGMVTTISDTTATADLQVYRSNTTGGVGSDICQTSATTINSLTKSNIDFNIDPTAIDPGDILMVRLAVAVNDAATATAVIAEISSMQVICDTRG